MAGTPLQIVVGLGNPGPEHRLTRHNAGFWFVDALAQRHGAQFRPHARYQGEIAKLTIEQHELVLLKPQTYMNRSGLSIRALMDYIKAPVQQVLVVHDELDLPCGVARLKQGGGHGGHNGLRDTITHCGADFWRLRLGIGHPGDKSLVIDYVLQRARPADETAIAEAIAAGQDALASLLREGAEKAMHRLHSSTRAADGGRVSSG
ncbi:MAG: aminoacyl-tRNA hydrolase [Steroidobacteraceae bacterium]